MRRAGFTIVIFVLILLTPFWFYFSLLLLSTLFFNYYWEAIILGLTIDILYGPVVSIFQLKFGIILLIAIITIPFIKERLRLNA